MYLILNELVLIIFVILFFYTFFHWFYLKTRKANKSLLHEIRSMIEPKFIEFSPRTDDLLELATEIWRLKHRITKITEKLPENNKLSLENSIQKLFRFLERNDIEVLDYTGEPYNENNSSVEVVTVEKDENLDRETIKEMIEPGFLIKGKLVKKGKVIVSAKK